MNKIYTLIIAGLLIALSAASIAQTTRPQTEDKSKTEKPQMLIRDGFALPNNGIDGKVEKDKDTGKWYFTPEKDLTDTKGLIKTGQPTELLPSSTLEKIILTIKSDPNSESDRLDVKLWGKVTRYTNLYSSKQYFHKPDIYADKIYAKNYIFPASFNKLITVKEDSPIELKPIPKPEDKKKEDKSIIPQTAREKFESQRKELAKRDEQKLSKNSIIPDKITERFKLKKVEDLSKWKKSISVESDAMISNRIGFFTKSGDDIIFRLDALGRDVIDMEFKLLPCEALQWAQRELAKNPGRLRYKVSGTITKFEGDSYLLLQRSVRAYNHGNFAY